MLNLLASMIIINYFVLLRIKILNRGPSQLRQHKFVWKLTEPEKSLTQSMSNTVNQSEKN